MLEERTALKERIVVLERDLEVPGVEACVCRLCVGMCAGICLAVCADIRVGMYIDLCVDLCADVCVDTCVDDVLDIVVTCVWWHVHRLVCRPVC